MRNFLKPKSEVLKQLHQFKKKIKLINDECVFGFVYLNIYAYFIGMYCLIMATIIYFYEIDKLCWSFFPN